MDCTNGDCSSPIPRSCVLAVQAHDAIGKHKTSKLQLAPLWLVSQRRLRRIRWPRRSHLWCDAACFHRHAMAAQEENNLGSHQSSDRGHCTCGTRSMTAVLAHVQCNPGSSGREPCICDTHSQLVVLALSLHLSVHPFCLSNHGSNGQEDCTCGTRSQMAAPQRLHLRAMESEPQLVVWAVVE